LVPSRNPTRTRQAILDAARQEFAARGAAGARVDRIAQAAGTNKRMIYHYFGSKTGLYQALLVDRVDLVGGASAHIGESLEARLSRLDAVLAIDPARVRLLMWEALEGRRPASTRRSRSTVSDSPSELEPGQVDLALVAVALFPWAFPDLAHALSGANPGTDAFAQARSRFFRALGRYAAQLARAPAEKPKVRLRPNVVDRSTLGSDPNVEHPPTSS
jgi:AcrR family transcriptional regulator